MKLRFLFSICALFSVVFLTAQHSFSGRVTNQNGEALISASVFFVGTSYGAVSNDQGYFKIDDIAEGAYDLKVTYVGYAAYTESIQIYEDTSKDIALGGTIFDIDRIEIRANRLSEDAPFSYSEIKSEELNVKNIGVDLPFLVEQTPSVTVTSDAGTGIGYTGIRVRGTDATRVNVTINGVPLNDSESHGVFWVNMPDFGSSVKSIQLQRGVGPSTNGTGSFGATLSLNTHDFRKNPFAEINSTFGSFNSSRFNVNLGTGLMNDRYFVQARVSTINSEGYIDRGSANLNSWFVSAGSVGENHSIRFNAFSGNEVTYQSWYGVPESKVKGDEEELRNHYFRNLGSTYNTVQDSLNLFQSGRNYNYYLYENQVDDYGQDHFQLHHAWEATDDLIINTTAHYTKGAGFFEEFKFQEDISDYLLTGLLNNEGESISTSDLVRRRWLDNDFYGILSNLEYHVAEDHFLDFGFAWNRYDGDHFGRVIDVADAVNFERSEYYNSVSQKTDFSAYVRLRSEWVEGLQSYVDLQYRNLDYTSTGNDNDLTPINIDEAFSFFNPKFGLNYQLNNQSQVYGSFAVANREPVRSDFIDAIGIETPSPEQLMDIELGYRYRSSKFSLNANLYNMIYNDQLVVTGAVNDVGAPVRVNVDNSYRRGIELDAQVQLTDHLSWSPNLTLSQNKIERFDEVVIDYGTGGLVITEYEDVDIALSPNMIAGSRLSYMFDNSLGFTLQSKLVGPQYLDNTQSANKRIDGYTASDLIVQYSIENKLINGVDFKFVVNNIFDADYSSNGYTFSYIFGDLITENYLYPQAGIHFFGSVTLRF